MDISTPENHLLQPGGEPDTDIVFTGHESSVPLEITLKASLLETRHHEILSRPNSVMSMAVKVMPEEGDGREYNLIEQPQLDANTSLRQFSLNVTVPANSTLLLEQKVEAPGVITFSYLVKQINMRHRKFG